MASTRYHHPMVEIYQDAYDSVPMPTSKKSSAPKASPPARALQDASSRRNIIFTPPYAEMSGRKASPLKSSSQRLNSPLSSSPSHRPFNTKLNMMSIPPPQSSAMQTDSIEKRMPMQKFRAGSQKALFTTFMTTLPEDKDKENTQLFFPSQYSNQSTKADFPIDPSYGQKGVNKRTLMDAAPIQESTRPFKKSKANSSAPQIPAPDEFPALRDDGKKPAQSYAQLIGMAILRASNRRLTLAQIYKWISDTYSFYNPADAGWQNSIRHNLSLNKAFIKQERPKDDPGKGNYWAIAPGTEHQFIKGKHGGKASIGENIEIQASAPTLMSDIQSSFQVSNPAKLDLPAPSSSAYVPESLASAPAPAPAPDMSSDATIPASDAFIPDEEPEEESLMPPPSNNFLTSSPPPPMHSSPPVSRHSHRDDTPPPVPPFPSSSALRSHRRKVASMDDSGYFSGLSSSAIRPHNSQKNRFLGSEADRERNRFKNRGRAEEEIARLRGSSYDSPTKSVTRPTRSVGFSSQPRVDSSPIRPNQKTSNYDSSQMLPPLTPALKFKAPERPPPSVSPNANLRLHRQSVRELIGSPLRDVTVLDENLPWSPAFNLDEGPYIYDDSDLAFDVYADAEISAGNFNIDAIQANIMNGSPEKKELRKARTLQEGGRSKSSGALGDITGTRANNPLAGGKSATNTPRLKFTPQLSPHVNIIGNENTSSPTKFFGFSGNIPGKTAMPLDFSSPCKMFSSPSKVLFGNPMMDMGFGGAATGGFDLGLPGDDWIGDDFLINDFDTTVNAVDQENMDPITGFEGGVDLLGGFQRIGSGRNGGASSTAATFATLGGTRNANLGNGGGRPSMGRSFTSRF